MTRPWFAFELTQSCTRNCLFCYNFWKADGSPAREALGTAQAISLLEKLAGEADPSGLTLTGGEPLLREDLEDLSAAASRLFPALCLSTTADGLTPDRARRLIRAGLIDYEVALSAARQETLSSLCGASPPIGKTVEAVSLLSGAGARVTASIVLCTANAPELREIILLAAASGARAACLNPFAPSGAGSAHPGLRLTPKALASSARTAAAASGDTGLPVYFGMSVRRCTVPADVLEVCRSGPCVCCSGKWAIGPAGFLRPCEQSPLELGNLFEHGFRDLAESAGAAAFRRLPRGCEGCGMISGCGGGCRAGGEPESPGSQFPDTGSATQSTE